MNAGICQGQGLSAANRPSWQRPVPNTAATITALYGAFWLIAFCWTMMLSMSYIPDCFRGGGKHRATV